MKVTINFKKYIIENSSKELEISFNTTGIYQDNILKFIDDSKAMNFISVNLFEIIVERKSDISTIMSFKKHQKTKFIMNASFGNLELDIYTNELIVNKESLFIVYNVLEDFNSYKTYELHVTFTPIK